MYVLYRMYNTCCYRLLPPLPTLRRTGFAGLQLHDDDWCKRMWHAHSFYYFPRGQARPRSDLLWLPWQAKADLRTLWCARVAQAHSTHSQSSHGHSMHGNKSNAIYCAAVSLWQWAPSIQSSTLTNAFFSDGWCHKRGDHGGRVFPDLVSLST